MSHDNDYCSEQIIDNLLGGTIIGTVVSPPDEEFGDEGFFGLQVMVMGKRKLMLVQSDAEGNGPGWVHIEDAEEAKEAG